MSPAGVSWVDIGDGSVAGRGLDTVNSSMGIPSAGGPVTAGFSSGRSIRRASGEIVGAWFAELACCLYEIAIRTVWPASVPLTFIHKARTRIEPLWVVRMRLRRGLTSSPGYTFPIG